MMAARLGCCMGSARRLGGSHGRNAPEVWSGAPPGPALVLYGGAAWFGSGYLLGSSARRRPPSRFDLRVAGFTAALAFALKALAPALAAWTAVLIAGAVFGVVAGMVRTR
jgi:hypothetical protein